MPYTVLQMQAMDARELLDLAEYDADEFTTSDTERALIQHLKDAIEIIDDLSRVDMRDVENVLDEVSAQFPEDDFLGHAIDIADAIARGKMRKDDMQREAARLSEMLHEIQNEQQGATEYANHEILKLTQPDAAKLTQKG